MGVLNTTPTTDPNPAGALEAGPMASTQAAPPTSPSWIKRCRGRWQWRIHPAWVALLEGKDCPDWLNLETDPRAEQVKKNDGRQVWRLYLRDQEFYVKIAWPGRQWSRCRRVLYGPDAERERRIAAYAQEHRIKAIRPVAVATAPIRPGQAVSILVTLGISSAQPLNERWASLDPRAKGTRQTKNLLIDAAARLIAHAHQNGFAHFDLHAGNVLVRASGQGYEALFVDLHNIRLGRSVDQRNMVRNLAQFNQWFRIHATLADRVRFLKQYLHWHAAFAADGAYARRIDWSERQFLREMERAAHTHANKLYSKRDRRTVRDGRYFAELKLKGGWRAHVFRSAKHAVPGSRASEMTFTKTQWRQWLSDPVRWVTPTDRRGIIKDSRTAMVCRAWLEGDEGQRLEVVGKRSLPRNFLKRLKNIVCTSRPMLTWKRANALINRNIPTARPLAVVEKRCCGLLLDSLILTEYLEHASDLDTLLTVRLREMKPSRQRRIKNQINDTLARVIRKLHDRGFTHRDLKAPNVMVQWNPESTDPPRVLLVDLDGLRLPRRPAPRRQRRALARLNISLDHCRRVSLADRVRFLQAYLRRPGCPQPDWKPLWREVAALSGPMRQSRSTQQAKLLKKYGRF